MTIPAWYGAFAAAAGLLALGGALKAARPNDTANALRALGLPGARILVRAGGLAELVVGLAAVASGHRAAAGAVACSYAAFAVFVVVAMRSGTPVSTCGCFGEVDAPPTVLHAVLNLAAAGCATVAALAGSVPSVNMVVAAGAWRAVTLAMLTVTAGYLAYLAMSVLPRTLSLTKSPR